MKEPKLICCDIDGTLVKNDKSLSDENIEWIRKAVKEKNAKFAIVSGRIYSAITQYYDQLGIKGPTSSLNGTILYDEHDNIIIDHRLPMDIAIQVLNISRKFDIELLTIKENSWFTENQDGYLYSEKFPIYKQQSILCSFEELLQQEEMNKMLFMSPDSSKLEGFKNYLIGNIENTTYYYGNNFIEVMPFGINKGSAIDDLSKYYNIDKSNIMALGDDYNDIEMLSKAGISVAMRNAYDEIKKVAHYITESNEDDGVAKAIQKIFFNKQII